MTQLYYSSAVLFALLFSSAQAESQSTQSIYDYKVETINGDTIRMDIFRGKKLLIVNTASKCGFTPQYKELEALYQKYGGDKFIIVGFPANNFMHQEPGSNTEIQNFCQKNYGVSFPMMAKISVKGNDIHPLYKWLTSKNINGVMDSKVKWNFQKYMIDPDGKLVGVIGSSTNPMSPEIINWITKP
jgi:glutathione peroxidase